MEFLNYTPFSPITFESSDFDGTPFQVVILRGTFKIIPDAPLKPILEQQPIITTDEFYGEPNISSIRFESDLAPYKPKSDIIINATAYPPGKKKLPYWMVGARIGKLQKQLLVTGPRFWKHHLLGGWKITDPQPCEEVPIRYEYAYGGQWRHEKKAGVCEENPVGVGYVNPKYADKDKPVPVPRIMFRTDTVTEFGKIHSPEGFSVIARSWLPRRKYAGTFDEKWLKERHPLLPKDFDAAFCNCAHPDMIYDGYLKGNEAIVLINLHPEHEILRFSLPKYLVWVAITDRDDYRYGSPANLDTFHADIDRMKVYLVWRITLPLYEDGIRVIETKMKQT